MNQLPKPAAQKMKSPQASHLSSRLSDISVYHELGVRHPYETNVLEELKNNLEQLENLHLRLKYMMNEIGQITRKRN